MHGDGDHSAQGEAANMSTFDLQCVHGRENRSGEIVTRRAVDKLAFAIARIIECNGSPYHPEVIELGPPDAFVGTYAMQEQDRRFAAAAFLKISDAPPRGRDTRHRGTMDVRVPALQGAWPGLSFGHDPNDRQW